MPEKITELPIGEVWKDYQADHLGQVNGQLVRKSPWKFEPLPDEIQHAPITMYVFNVGPLQHIYEGGSLGRYIIRPCLEGKEYSEPVQIRKYTVNYGDIGNYEHKTNVISDENFAREMVTPGGDAETDLRMWGVFATKNNPPTKAELDRANALLEKKLAQLIRKADRLYEANTSGTKDLSSRDQITDIYRIAAKKLRQTRPWTSLSKQMDECPYCFAAVPMGAAQCNVGGTGCKAILDYPKALRGGIITDEVYARAVEKGWVPGEGPAADSEPEVPTDE